MTYYLKFLIVNIITFSIGLFLNSCSKNHVVLTYNLSKDIINYGYFKEKSKWVYQNDSTLVHDTILVVESTKRISAGNMDDGMIDWYIESVYIQYITILNYFDNRSTNASAESFNAKIKALRAAFRGVKNISFFLFRLSNIYA